MKTIMSIDPGNKESAYVIWDGSKIHDFEKIDNEKMLTLLSCGGIGIEEIVIEQVACYGMPVGEDIFETVFWTGRFYEAWDGICHRMKRHEVKMHLCHNNRAKDSNIIAALVDRFDPNRKHGKYGKGTKKNPGMFYGFSKDVWQAFALGVTYIDIEKGVI